MNNFLMFETPPLFSHNGKYRLIKQKTKCRLMSNSTSIASLPTGVAPEVRIIVFNANFRATILGLLSWDMLYPCSGHLQHLSC